MTFQDLLVYIVGYGKKGKKLAGPLVAYYMFWQI